MPAATWRSPSRAAVVSSSAARRADGSPAASYALTVNRRSGQCILDAANVLSGPLREDPELRWDGVDTDLVAPEGTPRGDIRVASFDTWDLSGTLCSLRTIHFRNNKTTEEIVHPDAIGTLDIASSWSDYLSPRNKKAR